MDHIKQCSLRRTTGRVPSATSVEVHSCGVFPYDLICGSSLSIFWPVFLKIWMAASATLSSSILRHCRRDSYVSAEWNDVGWVKDKTWQRETRYVQTVGKHVQLVLNFTHLRGLKRVFVTTARTILKLKMQEVVMHLRNAASLSFLSCHSIGVNNFVGKVINTRAEMIIRITQHCKPLKEALE